MSNDASNQVCARLSVGNSARDKIKESATKVHARAKIEVDKIKESATKVHARAKIEVAKMKARADQKMAKMKVRADQARDRFFWVSNKVVHHQRFLGMCKTAFEDTDLDKSGGINETELFVAVLSIFHKININVPGKNHKPPHFKTVKKMFSQFDNKSTGKLDEAEFIAFCQDICIDLVPRVLVQAAGSLILAPFMALLLYALTSAIIPYASETLAYLFHIPPRALVTPVFATLFTITLLPYMVNIIESSYLKAKANYEVDKDTKED